MWQRNTVETSLPQIIQISSLEQWSSLHGTTGMAVEMQIPRLTVDPLNGNLYFNKFSRRFWWTTTFRNLWIPEGLETVKIKACLCLPESQIPFGEVSLQYIKKPTLEKHSQTGHQCWVLSNEVSFVKTNHVFINNSMQVDITSPKMEKWSEIFLSGIMETVPFKNT